MSDTDAQTARPTYMLPMRLCGVRHWWWKQVRRWPGETCQRCGRAYGCNRSLVVTNVWRATEQTWFRIVGSHEGGRYCVPCFIRGCNVTGNHAYLTIQVKPWEGMRDLDD